MFMQASTHEDTSFDTCKICAGQGKNKMLNMFSVPRKYAPSKFSSYKKKYSQV